jgi:hypothetical protein
MSELVSSFMIFAVATKAATGATPRIAGGRLGEGLGCSARLNWANKNTQKDLFSGFRNLACLLNLRHNGGRDTDEKCNHSFHFADPGGHRQS